MYKHNGNYRAIPRKVDYFAYQQDFQCVLLAAIGLHDEAIVDITGLTIGQVRYRIRQPEKNRRKGTPSARKLYRRGESPVVQAIIGSVGRGNNPVRRIVASQLNDKGLYAPKSNGVLTHRK